MSQRTSLRIALAQVNTTVIRSSLLGYEPPTTRRLTRRAP